ncbi:hypothetical protein AMTRI_Chr03g142530 [Amborella trichopoda]
MTTSKLQKKRKNRLPTQLTPNRTFLFHFFTLNLTFLANTPMSKKSYFFDKYAHSVPDRPYFMLGRMPKVMSCPYFVSDCMPKVPNCSYFVPDLMFSKSKVLDRPQFVLDRMFFKGYFGLHFTFL